MASTATTTTYKIEYYLYKGLYRILGFMPWCLIDGLSYIIAGILYGLVAYRRSIVEQNLRRSFPSRSPLELRELAWQFYHHLAYQFLSTPKILYQSPEVVMDKHLRFVGLEQLQADKEAGAKAFILLLGHYGNWEVFTASNLYLKPIGLQVEQLYRKLKNKAFDAVQLELRTRFGAITTAKGDVGRRIISAIKRPDGSGEVHAFAFIADQKPGNTPIPLWTTFLHQNTPWVNGAERLARKYALPVYYVDVRRVGKRAYEGEFVCITHNAQTTELDEVTRTFATLLEQTIERDPALWLWSHKRWKHNGY